MSSFSTPGLTGSKSFSFFVDCSQKIWSPDRLEPRQGDLLRADPEAWRFSSLRRPRRAAPPLRARKEYSSRAEKSVTRLLCPQGPFQGGRGRGKPLCRFLGPVGRARSGSGYRQVSLADGRAAGARELLARRAPAAPEPARVCSPTGGVRPPQRWRQCCASPGAPEQGP